MKAILPLASIMVIGLLGCQSLFVNQETPPNLTDWPSRAEPKKIGLLLTGNFLNRPFTFQISPRRKTLIYPEVLAWRGALMVSKKADTPELLEQMTKKFDYFLTEKGSQALSLNAHVDDRVTGVVPLEIYAARPVDKYKAVGLSFADLQWENPTTNGFTQEAKYAVNDLYMINALQVAAYRASGNSIYLNRAAVVTADYLAKLQQGNGLFNHAMAAPFHWARGNGWFAAGMAELLCELPKDHSQYTFIKTRYTMMMDALVACQSKDGLWRQLLDKPEYWEETSGSAMFVYAMTLGLKHDILVGDQYVNAVRKGWLALTDKVDSKGNISDVCIGTNASDVQDTYLKRPRLTGDLHGQMAMLWCASALMD